MSRPAFGEIESLAFNYVKAIGIITVVIGHYPGDPFDFFKPYLYHMPLFFFLGGILIKAERNAIDHLMGIIRKHISYVVVVYILTAFIIFCLHSIYSIGYKPLWRGGLIDSIYYPIKNNMHGGSYFLVAWFLLAYAFVSFFGFLIIKTISSNIKNGLLVDFIVFIVASVFGYVGMNVISPIYNETKVFYYNFSSQVLVGSCFFLFGYSIRKVILKISGVNGFIVSFVFIYLFNRYGYLTPLGMSWSRYPLGFFNHFFTSLSGIYVVFCLAKILSFYGKVKILEVFGKSSKAIMSYHVLVFVFIDVIFYYLGLWDIKKTSPLVNFNDRFTWPIYVGLGLMIPTIFSSGFRGLIKNRIFGKLSRKIL